MEFSQLKQEYKFLEEILYLFDILDQPVDENDQNKEFLSNCNDVHILKGDTTGKYVNFCKKLSRNLLLLDNGRYGGGNFFKYCDILYMWMYFEINRNSISNEITKEIFNKSTEIIKSKIINKHCPYFNFNENLHEPRKLMKLSIFNYNVDTFQSMLKGPIKSYDCSLIRYIYKCILIYRDMNSKYCSGKEGTKEENINSCDIIRKFNSFYTPYFSGNNELTQKFPELTSGTALNDIDGCSLEGMNSDEFSDQTQLYTPITKGVSTALGAMAGIPPFLALIYKFTPVGQLIRSRYYKGIDNIIGGNELFYPTTENTNNSSDHMRYNVLYGPVSN